MKQVNSCERCGAESNHLHTLRTGHRGRLGDNRKREKVCPSCLALALENRGMTVGEIAQDNQRWDRIFAAKFADPEYYSRRIPTPQSSFGAFAFQVETVCGVLRTARHGSASAA